MESKTGMFRMRDGFGDYYTFHYDSDEATRFMVPIAVDFRLPFWYDDANSVGADIGMNFIYSGIAQANMDVYYCRTLNDRLQVSVFGGWTLGMMSVSLGKLKSAWTGDPGYYAGKGKWIKPGTEMELSGGGFDGWNAGASVKFRPLRLNTFFVQLGYRYTSDVNIDKFTLKIDDMKFDADDLENGTVRIGGASHIFLTVGFGL